MRATESERVEKLYALLLLHEWDSLSFFIFDLKKRIFQPKENNKI